MRPLAKEANKPETRDAIYAHFVQLVRENLHIVLCVSPIGDAFRIRTRMFPSLVNCCTVSRFQRMRQTRHGPTAPSLSLGHDPTALA